MYQLQWQPASIPSEREGRAGRSKPEAGSSWATAESPPTRSGTTSNRIRRRVCWYEPGLDFERLTPDTYRLDPAQPEHFRQLLEDAFTDERPPCRGVVHLWNLLATPPADTSPESLESDTTLGPVSALHLVQALALAGWQAPPRLWLVTGGVQVTDTSETGTESVSIAQAPVWGLGRTIDHEHPELHCTLIDLSAGDSPDEAREEAEALFREVWADDREDEVALRGSRRYIGRLTRYDEAKAAETPRLQGGSHLSCHRRTRGARARGGRVDG